MTDRTLSGTALWKLPSLHYVSSCSSSHEQSPTLYDFSARQQSRSQIHLLPPEASFGHLEKEAGWSFLDGSRMTFSSGDVAVFEVEELPPAIITR